MNDSFCGKSIFTFLYLLSVILLSGSTTYGAIESAIHSSPELRYPQTAEFAISPGTPAKAVRFFFRQPGVTMYQMRFMTEKEPGYFTYGLNTATLTDIQLVYYFEILTENGNFTYPEKAPTEPIALHVKETEEDQLEVFKAQATMAPQSRLLANLPVKIAANGSFKYKISSNNNAKSGIFEKRNFLSDNNIRIAKTVIRDKYSIDFSANLTQSNTSTTTDDDIWLSYFNLKASSANHSLAFGDINIDGSYFTGEYWNQRGVGYQYAGTWLRTDFFWTGSRSNQNWDNFVPGSDNHIYGANISVDILQEHLTVDMHYRQGRDDPQNATNSSSFYSAVKEGSIATITPKVYFFNKSLLLFGEYASSRFDNDINKGENKVTDDGWRTGIEYSADAWQFKGHYLYINPDFESIVNHNELYFIHDRKGFDLTTEYFGTKLSALLGWEQLEDNLNDNPNLDWSTYETLRGTANYQLLESILLTGGLRRISDKSFADLNQHTQLKNAITYEFESGVNYTFLPDAFFQLNGTFSTSSDTTTPDNDTDVSTISASFSYSNSGLFQFYPSVSWSESEMTKTGNTNSTISYYLNWEYYFLPNLFSLSSTESYSKGYGDSSTSSENLSLIANFNLHLNRQFDFFNEFIVSLSGEYQQNKLSNSTNDSYTIWLQCDYAF